MNTKNIIYGLFVIGCVWTLSACTKIIYPDLYQYESFQIANTSSSDVTLRFYETGRQKTVSAELFDGPFVKDLNPKEAEVPRESLWTGHELTLQPGQTALFYSYGNPLQKCGQEGPSLHLFNFSWFIGDSCTISKDGSPYEVLPLQTAERWETWFDEKNYIYYHFWRIE